MQRLLSLFVFVGILSQLVSALLGAEFRLSNGDILQGEAAGFADEGLVVRLDIGGFSPRIPWSRITQETLKALVKNPQARAYVEPFIELTAEQLKQAKDKAKPKQEMVIKPVPRLERPAKAGFFAALTTPAVLLIVMVFYLANLYGAYEIAVYRQRPAALVCAVSALLPLAGPLIFLGLPSLDDGTNAEPGPSPEAAAAEALVSNPLAGGKKTGPAPSALGIAAADKKSKPVATSLEGAVFKRGETTFNRRFFEAKFSGFFSVVALGPEKDLVLVFRADKKEIVAKRISRISSNEVHLQALSGAETGVAFTEIVEVLVRRKDAKG